MPTLFRHFHITTIYWAVPSLFSLLSFSALCVISVAAQSSQNSNAMTIGIGGSILSSNTTGGYSGQTNISNTPRLLQVPLDVKQYPVAPLGLELQQVHVFVRHGKSSFSCFHFQVCLGSSLDSGRCTAMVALHLRAEFFL